MLVESDSSIALCSGLFNYLTGEVTVRPATASDRLPPVSGLRFQRPGLVPTILERDPHSSTQSQRQLAASPLALLTVHSSYFHVYILILTRARCFVMGILICGRMICRAQSPLRGSCASRAFHPSGVWRGNGYMNASFEKTWLSPVMLLLHPPVQALIIQLFWKTLIQINSPCRSEKICLPYTMDRYWICPVNAGRVRELAGITSRNANSVNPSCPSPLRFLIFSKSS